MTSLRRFDRPGTAAILWLGLVMAILLAIAFLLPVTPQDFWWYLRVGRDTLANGAIPVLDTLSASQADSPVVNFAWGSAVLLWLVYDLGGLTLVVLLRGILLALGYLFIWQASRRLGAGRFGAALVLLLAVLSTSNNWSLRPQLFAYPLFALAVLILVRWQAGEGRCAWWLIPISLLWVNLHGSFILLILMTAAALMFGRGDRRQLALALAGVILATLVNPCGPGAWAYVYETLSLPAQQFSVEWQPPVNQGWQMNLFFGWLLLFPLLAAFSPRKLDRLTWAWFLAFGVLALWGQRYVIWFVMLLAVFTAALLSDWEAKFIANPEKGSPVLNLVLGSLLCLLTLALLPGFRSTWWRQAPPAVENTPVAAVGWLAVHPELPGPLWSEIGFASYLEFQLPSRPPWIDSRFIPFTVDQWQSYQTISIARYDWQDLLVETGAKILMVSLNTQPQLVQALEDQLQWCDVYRDDVAVIYKPCGSD